MSSPFTIGNLRDSAASFFQSTMGQSPRIASHYASLSSSATSLQATPSNVNNFVTGENRALWSSTTPATWRDRVAMVATPLRRPAAHLFAQNVTVGQQRYFANNEYSRAALSGVISGTFD